MEAGASNYFKNSVRIRVNELIAGVSRKDIYLAVCELIDEDAKYISHISSIRATRNWIISFSEEYHINAIVGKKVLIGSLLHTIEDAIDEIDPSTYATFRLHWLPHGYQKVKIEQFVKSINKAYQVVNFVEETCREEIMKHVKNGNIRIKLKMKKSEMEKGPALQTGVHRIEGFRFLVTRIGEKPKCLICSSSEHLKRECPELKKKCSKCNNIGHLAEKCTYSLKVSGKQVEEMQQLPDEDDDDEEEYDAKQEEMNSQSESVRLKQKVDSQDKANNGKYNKAEEQKNVDIYNQTSQINASSNAEHSKKSLQLNKPNRNSITQSDAGKANNEEKDKETEKKRKLELAHKSSKLASNKLRKSQLEQERKSESQSVELMDTNNESATKSN
jgi:hypothetical protein